MGPWVKVTAGESMMLEEYERQAQEESRWGRFIAIGVTILGVVMIGIYLTSI
jgi:hypothetical protein